jgi:rod shape-determining protein MreC
VFLFLEAVSVGLVATSYSYQGSLVVNTVNDFTGGILETLSNVSGYFALKKENELLVEENATLRSNCPEAFLITDTNTVYVDTLYRFIPAHVVYLTLNKSSNYFMINKGKRHGIKKESGVISTTGIAGIVIGVSDNYALVLSLLNPHFAVSARLKKYGTLVSVLWDGEDYRYGKMIDIPSHLELSVGDTLVTTGYSTVFPEGMLVGFVEEYQPAPEKEFAEGKIRFATDFKTLQDVYVVDHLKKAEMEKLMEEAND